MADWNPSQYLKFKEQRTQPARDLAARVLAYHPQKIADIGCGPGNSTAVLRQFFPEAHLTGVDNSPAMVEKAAASYPAISFRLCDALSLESGWDMLFSNACLQWIPDHPTLLPALMDKLNPGGVLAVQVPMNGEEPFFRLIREVAAEARWGLRDVKLQPNETLPPAEYFDILSGCASSFDMWEVKYYHAMPDHGALVDWVRSTRLRPYLDALGDVRGAEFESVLTKRARELYPVTASGEVVLGFRRFFFTAVK